MGSGRSVHDVTRDVSQYGRNREYASTSAMSSKSCAGAYGSVRCADTVCGSLEGRLKNVLRGYESPEVYGEHTVARGAKRNVVLDAIIFFVLVRSSVRWRKFLMMKFPFCCR